MERRYVWQLALIVAIALGFSACEKDKEEPEKAEIEFRILHAVESELVEFDTIKYTNAFGNLYSVATLKYFISDIKLHSEGGGEFLIDDEFYIDARDEATTAFSPDTNINAGDYTAISFIFGLNDEKNERGRFPNAPESNMEWPFALGPGYHYMKLEGKHDSSGTIRNYQGHTGPTNGNSNFINISIPSSAFSVEAGDEAVIELVMNINNWWEEPNTLDLNDVTMVMGNQEMQEKLKANGSNVFGMKSVYWLELHK